MSLSAHQIVKETTDGFVAKVTTLSAQINKKFIKILACLI